MDSWFIGLVCAAGFVGVITGGSGILTTATMIGLGLSPHHAVANTRFAVFGTDVTSMIAFHRADRIRYRPALPLAGIAGLAALGAAQTLESIPKADLKRIIGGSILLLVLITLAFPRIGAETGRPRKGAAAWVTGGLIAIATALTTVAGGAAGALFSCVLVLVFGQSFLDSAGTRKVVAMALTPAAAPTFAFKGLVDLRCLFWSRTPQEDGSGRDS